MFVCLVGWLVVCLFDMFVLVCFGLFSFVLLVCRFVLFLSLFVSEATLFQVDILTP